MRGRRIEHAWGGPIDVSPTHLPVVGSLGRGRVHYAFGYTGNGVAPSRLAGRALASMALDRRDEATAPADRRAAAGSCPPEPFRYAGGTIIRAALLRRERLEEEGRRPGPLTRAISGRGAGADRDPHRPLSDLRRHGVRWGGDDVHQRGVSRLRSRLRQERRASGYYQDRAAGPVQLGAHISSDHDTTCRGVGL